MGQALTQKHPLGLEPIIHQVIAKILLSKPQLNSTQRFVAVVVFDDDVVAVGPVLIKKPTLKFGQNCFRKR